MESLFTELVGEYSSPANAVPVASGELDALAERLPPELLAFWREYGLGSWLDGKFQFCRPTDYAELVEQIFEDDPDLLPSATPWSASPLSASCCCGTSSISGCWSTCLG